MTSDGERKSLKFASGPSTTLALADKNDSLAATIRYEDERGIEEGDTLDALSSHTEEVMGEVEVKHTEIVPAGEALGVVRRHSATYGSDSVDKLISELNKYYDEPLGLSTEVKVIIMAPDMGDSDGN